MATVTSDFERGLAQAIAVEFPEAKHKSCNFHFFRRCGLPLQSLGYSRFTATTRDLYVLVKSVNTLAFLPVKAVTAGFDLREKQAENFPER